MNGAAVASRALLLKIRQPSAHYRVPFAFRRRHTYPIPPFSTVIGFLCNVLGIKNQQDKRFTQLKNLYMAVYGNYESLEREYVWFRNLSAKEHKERFGSTHNRKIDGVIEHPGGQSPVKQDVLYNVELLIFLFDSSDPQAVKDDGILKRIKESLSPESSQSRLYPLHLGRAEDLIIFEEKPRFVEIKFPEGDSGKAANLPYFAWVPQDFERVLVKPDDKTLNGIQRKYKRFFSVLPGTFHRITTFYELKRNRRIFDFVRVKLFEKGALPLDPFGKVFPFPWVEFEKGPGVELDKRKKLPLILVKVG